MDGQSDDPVKTSSFINALGKKGTKRENKVQKVKGSTEVTMTLTQL